MDGPDTKKDFDALDTGGSPDASYADWKKQRIEHAIEQDRLHPEKRKSLADVTRHFEKKHKVPG